MFPVLGIVGVLGLAGCSGGAAVESANATSANATTASGQHAKDVKHARGHHHGGPDFLIFAALHENIGLSAEQRTTIEGLAKEDHQVAHPAPDKAKMAAFAAAIRAGKVDASVLPDHPQPSEDALKARLAASASKLATLHKTLTPAQRVALIDALTAKHGDHEGEHRQHAEGRRGDHHGGAMGMFLHGLDLTQEQKDQIKAKLDAERPAPPTDAQREEMKARFEAMKKEHEAKLQSFKSDNFDANAFVAPPANAPKPPAPSAERRVKELQIVLSVLDQAQREKLAQRIEQHSK
jgi:Spy/CpxP family protein refolding chaperone